MNKKAKSIFRHFMFLIIAFFILIVTINVIVVWISSTAILSEQEALSQTTSPRVAIILGAAIWGNQPSPMLKERLDTGIALYKDGKASALLMSGGGGDDANIPNEISVMTEYALAHGVSKDDIIQDGLGLNTQQSIHRAKYEYHIQTYYLISQKYHLQRAIFISKCYGANVTGVVCDKMHYKAQFYYDMREIPARVKDFFLGIKELLNLQIIDESTPR